VRAGRALWMEIEWSLIGATVWLPAMGFAASRASAVQRWQVNDVGYRIVLRAHQLLDVFGDCLGHEIRRRDRDDSADRRRDQNGHQRIHAKRQRRDHPDARKRGADD